MHAVLDRDDLRAIVAEVVREVLAQTGAASPAEALMTEPEAAQLLKVQPHTLRDARRRGVLQFHKAGRFVRYSRAHLDAWLDCNGGQA